MLRIFISYAKEDTVHAHELYIALRDKGHKPWMDKPPPPFELDGLLPGERWEDRLEQEMAFADRMLLLLSKTSVSKVGYVQREFRRALEIMNNMPVGRIFAIPTLIEQCTVPNLVVGHIGLQDLQWTNISELGIDRFIAAIGDEGEGI